MPTGYTSDIKNGITFEQYATNCLRNFGATIQMRDMPYDTPITKENICGGNVDGKSYHERELEKAKGTLKCFKSLSEAQQKMNFEDHKDDNIKRITEAIEEHKSLRVKYENMLEKVRKFVCPTDEHINYKKFMESQIVESIKFDCSTTYYDEELSKMQNLTFSDYLKQTEEKILWNIEYHQEQLEKEKNRHDNRWEWVSQALEAIKNVK